MNPFIGVAQSQLETWLAECQEELAGGTTLTQAAVADVNSQFMPGRNLGVERRIELLLKALNLLDPDTYPASQVQRVRVTTSRFDDL